MACVVGSDPLALRGALAALFASSHGKTSLSIAKPTPKATSTRTTSARSAFCRRSRYGEGFSAPSLRSSPPEVAESRYLKRGVAGRGGVADAILPTLPATSAANLDKGHMRYRTSQIVIGIIVTVVGTVLANAIIKAFGSRKHVIDGAHYSGPVRAGR